MVQASRLLTLLLVVPIAACAAPDEGYPTLAIRDVERTAGTMEVEPAPPPPAPAPATLASVAELAEAAREAHADFLDAAPRARSITRSAAGAARGSENWAQAQVAIANLEAQRSETMIALADLDRIFVDAATSAQATESIEAVRSDIDALVEQQNTLIESLLSTLSS